MNKHYGQDIEEYLKERGIYNTVKKLADKRYQELLEEEKEFEDKFNVNGRPGEFLDDCMYWPMEQEDA